MKLVSISIGNQCGEVFAKADVEKDTVTFTAKINGQTIAQGPVYCDLRDMLVEMFSTKGKENECQH